LTQNARINVFDSKAMKKKKKPQKQVVMEEHNIIDIPETLTLVGED
jgi:hypothetical protein